MNKLTGLFLLFCVISTFGVEVSKFRACKDSGFCKRQRKLVPASSPYHVIPDTLNTEGKYITAEVVNAKKNITFQMTFIAYHDRILRWKIVEKHPIKPRYEVQDVLVDTLREASFDSVEKLDLGFIAKFGDNRAQLKLTYSPLKVDLYIDDVLSISANDRGLFNFEHHRLKPQPVSHAPEVKSEEGENKESAPEPVEVNEVCSEEELEDAWEETFSSHPDSKPNGPESVGIDFSFIGAKHVYGIPEHASSLSLKSTKGDGIDLDPYRLYNLDVFEYELDKEMSLYGAVPLMLSHDEKKTVGVFWLNPSETFIDISDGTDTEECNGFLCNLLSKGRPKKTTHWFSESGLFDTFFIMGPSPKDVFAQYAALTGTGAMPQMFAVGYHQCRWNYKDEADVAAVDAAFDEHNIPYDVLWLDIEHTDGKRYFTWDQGAFPNPKQMQEKMEGKGRKMVVIIDPHIKRDSGYHIHSEAQSKNLYVKDKTGNEYDGWCWPGSSSYLDFFDPVVREFWGQKLQYNSYQGSTPSLYVWNDMNEPSVFNGPEVSMHKDAIHYGNWEHRAVHNLYGYYVHMATADGLINRHPSKNDRPFVLSRAFFAGTQRIGAIWTGDNAAQWGHLKAATPMILSLGIGGISFAGADVGGFFGNPDAELLTRWYQAGAYTPFFRGHAHIDTKRREPWLFGEPYTSHIRDAIRGRYALLPYWYTLFHINNQTGLPLVRPLWVEFPQEEETFAAEESFMVGGELLVHPVVEAGAQQVKVYLPGKGSVWYEYDTHKQVAGNQIVHVTTPLGKIPVYLRGGSIIPRKERPRRSSTQMAIDPYTLWIGLDKQGEATGQLYVDDGKSFNFRKGEFDKVVFTYENNKLQSVPQHVKCTDCEHPPVERIVILGTKKPSRVTVAAQQELAFEYFEETQKVVIRKPQVLATDAWTVELHF